MGAVCAIGLLVTGRLESTPAQKVNLIHLLIICAAPLRPFSVPDLVV
jgi:hypothetical protein